MTIEFSEFTFPCPLTRLVVAQLGDSSFKVAERPRIPSVDDDRGCTCQIVSCESEDEVRQLRDSMKRFAAFALLPLPFENRLMLPSWFTDEA